MKGVIPATRPGCHLCAEWVLHPRLLPSLLNSMLIFPRSTQYCNGAFLTALLTKRPDSELANLVWCILVAVSLALRQGKARSSLATHKFIMQWLSTVQKRKLFPKTLAQDIIWLQNEGKRYGPDARLYSKIEYAWLASSGKLASQSTLFRFTCMIDTLRTMGWLDHLLSDNEWDIGWNTGA